MPRGARKGSPATRRRMSGELPHRHCGYRTNSLAELAQHDRSAHPELLPQPSVQSYSEFLVYLEAAGCNNRADVEALFAVPFVPMEFHPMQIGSLLQRYRREHPVAG